MTSTPADITLFHTRLVGICREMGATLAAAAFSPNIRDRLDFSCALFDVRGRLCAQAAHIPVHLGSMAYAMQDLVAAFQWRPGDLVVLNDPFLGGTHLPDVTVVAPVFDGDALAGFVASRAHHADIGAEQPGSMPISRHLDEEGLVIAPQYLERDGRREPECQARFDAAFAPDSSTFGDIDAQASACRHGLTLFEQLIGQMGRAAFDRDLVALDAYAARLALSRFTPHAGARCAFEDLMDDDGAGTRDIAIRVECRFDLESVVVDFTGTDPEVHGNLNCPLSVTAAAVHYVFYCLMPRETPACHGAFARIRIVAPEGTLVNARRPAAVAAGNVETSSRIVDALLGALADGFPNDIPAASQGTMNNLAMGGPGWAYYETLGGGAGAHARGPGASGLHSHMTNTRNTPIEVIESVYPLRVLTYALREGSGGDGRHRGGDGIRRTYRFLADTAVTLITERREHAPWGLAGGAPGVPGRNLRGTDPLPAKVAFLARAGDELTIETPGGGGYGRRRGQA